MVSTTNLTFQANSNTAVLGICPDVSRETFFDSSYRWHCFGFTDRELEPSMLLKLIVFDRGFQIADREDHTVFGCTELESIKFGRMSRQFFDQPFSLAHSGFESGHNLTLFGDIAFGCFRAVIFPASDSDLDGSALVGWEIHWVSLEEGNANT
jgi:hypothetical protein